MGLYEGSADQSVGNVTLNNAQAFTVSRASGGATPTSAPRGTVAAVALTPLEGCLHAAATIP